MKTRIDIGKTVPAAYKALDALEKYLDASGISQTHRELIRLRASQINGCAYCVDLHARDALKHGEDQRRLNNLVTWKEAPFYSDAERAVLALTEEVTLIQGRVADATYENAIAVLGEEYAAHVIMAAVTINAWNRIGIATEMAPV